MTKVEEQVLPVFRVELEQRVLEGEFLEANRVVLKGGQKFGLGEEEDAVVSLDPAAFDLQVRSPERRILPIATVPLELSPGVPQLVDAGVFHLIDSHQRVGVVAHDTLHALGAGCQHHGIASSQELDDVLERSFFLPEEGT